MTNKYEPPYAGDTSPLVDAVLDEMGDAFATGELEAVDELLRFIPRLNLIQFLPEEQWQKFMTKEEKEELYK